MKELVFNTGGRPLFNNDLQTLQGETIESLSGILRGLGRPLVVSGCKLINTAGNLYKIEPGLVFIDDKILRFDGENGPNGNGIEITSDVNSVASYIVQEQTDLSPDRRTHKDGIEKNAITERKAVLLTTDTKPSGRESIAVTTVTLDVFWNTAFGRLTRFIDSIIQNDDVENISIPLPRVEACILSGFRITDRTSGIIRHTGGLIYYKGEIYEINPSNENQLLSEPNDPRLALDPDNPGKVKLVRNEAEGFILESEIERFDTIRRNRVFPSGTVLHIKMDSSQLEFNFKNNIGISKTWSGWMIDPDSTGKVIVGYDKDDTQFNEASGNKTGGEKRHTLSKREIPPHLHNDGDLHTSREGSHSHEFSFTGDRQLDHEGIYPLLRNNGDINLNGYNSTQRRAGMKDNGAHTHNISGHTGNGSPDGLSGQSHENMPPYVVYVNVVKI